MEDKLFDLVSEYKPQGDQPKAIKALVEGVKAVSYTHLRYVISIYQLKMVSLFILSVRQDQGNQP